MAKANTILVKLVSSADTGYFYVAKKNTRTQTGKTGVPQIRPGRPQARDLQGIQDQITPQDSRRASDAASNKRARGRPARSRRILRASRPASANIAVTAAAWSGPISITQKPSALSRLPDLRRDGAIGFEAVGAAVDGGAGFVIANFGRQILDLVRRHVGRIGDHDIELRRYMPSPVARDEQRARRNSNRFRVACRDTARLAVDIRPDPASARQRVQQGKQQASAACPEVENAAGTHGIRDPLERRLHHRFAVRPRIEGRWTEPERQASELPFAHDPRHGLSPGAPRHCLPESPQSVWRQQRFRLAQYLFPAQIRSRRSQYAGVRRGFRNPRDRKILRSAPQRRRQRGHDASERRRA